MADQPQSSTNETPAKREYVSIVELFELVKAYVRQETLGPLRGASRWLALGTAAALVLGLGLTLLMLGLLRLLQTEWDGVATGRWSWVPYLIVLVVVAALLLITLSRINKKSLNEEPN
jgi:uncharacterized BrkB/YihY/UPF0761 family membrane protein